MTNRFLIVAVAFIAAAFAVPAAASAATVCKSTHVADVRVELTVWGSTSCGLGVNVARTIVRRGYAPARMTVRSPTTGKRYRLRREWVENDFTEYWSTLYTGKGRGNSTINVQLQIWY